MSFLQFLGVPRKVGQEESPVVAFRTLCDVGPVSRSNSDLVWMCRRVLPKKNHVFLVRGALSLRSDGLPIGTVYDTVNVCQ
jgi:hypothetical protein